jgi:transcriptional regulator with XRE-family HTH domain
MRSMAKVRTNPLHEASIQAIRILHELGRELRLARISAGLSQAELARRLGTSQARISRFERARDVRGTLSELMRHAAAVGLRLWVRAYPATRRLLDEPQLQLLQRFRDRIAAAWAWELEVPVPIPGDLRAGDARITIGETTILVEAITRLADIQAQSRAAQLKRRDLDATRLILLVAATETNRRAVRAAGAVLSEAFPIHTAAAMRALARGQDPGADAIVLL